MVKHHKRKLVPKIQRVKWIEKVTARGISSRQVRIDTPWGSLPSSPKKSFVSPSKHDDYPQDDVPAVAPLRLPKSKVCVFVQLLIEQWCYHKSDTEWLFAWVVTQEAAIYLWPAIVGRSAIGTSMWYLSTGGRYLEMFALPRSACGVHRMLSEIPQQITFSQGWKVDRWILHTGMVEPGRGSHSSGSRRKSLWTDPFPISQWDEWDGCWRWRWMGDRTHPRRFTLLITHFWTTQARPWWNADNHDVPGWSFWSARHSCALVLMSWSPRRRAAAICDGPLPFYFHLDQDCIYLPGSGRFPDGQPGM